MTPRSRRHDPSGGVLDDKWLAGLDLRELVDRALDLRRLDLVERRVGALHERLAGQRVRMHFAVRVFLVEEERRLGLVLADPQVGHRDRELALDVDWITAVRVIERIGLGECLLFDDRGVDRRHGDAGNNDRDNGHG